jgi:AcrR family transcriptional regulator
MLNVRSVTPTHLEDKTAEARIRDAALARFTRDGFAGTTVRAIADDAAVSPALVLHHFGSKEGLRRACDAHVVERVRTVKSEAITEGRLGEPATMTAGFQMAEPLMRYLAWTLSTGSEAAADLFDDMVDESVRLFQLGVEHGSFEPSPDPRARAAVMLAMQMGWTGNARPSRPRPRYRPPRHRGSHADLPRHARTLLRGDVPARQGRRDAAALDDGDREHEKGIHRWLMPSRHEG